MTEPRIFKPGDKVKIRNRKDSPIMKVIKYVDNSDETVLVEWFNMKDGESHKEEHHQMALVSVNK